jgi:hypothetical protein
MAASSANQDVSYVQEEPMRTATRVTRVTSYPSVLVMMYALTDSLVTSLPVLVMTVLLHVLIVILPKFVQHVMTIIS